MFDEIIDRKGTNSLKYDFAKRYNKPEDAIPLWVADMDFKIPQDVTTVIENAVAHGIYGYTDSDQAYFGALYQWYATYHQYHPQESWLVKTPGMVFAIAMAVKAFTKAGDGVLIQKPLYYPIAQAITANNRQVVDNTLVYENGRYVLDLADFEAKIAQHRIKLFILCSPHNPGGRVWTAEELTAMGNICKKYGCIVFADEIHSDLVFKPHKHMVFANGGFGDFSIIATSPSKTFNLAGLQVSNIFIENANLRERFVEEIAKTGYSQLNGLGLVATQAAYTHGQSWYQSLMDYLAENVAYIQEYLDTHLPQIKLIAPESTYLLWLDFNATGLPHHVLEDMITHKAKLWLSSGTTFGDTGEGFFRINIACPQAVLATVMARLKDVF